jgi:hypothetical protein
VICGKRNPLAEKAISSAKAISSSRRKIKNKGENEKGKRKKRRVDYQ